MAVSKTSSGSTNFGGTITDTPTISSVVVSNVGDYIFAVWVNRDSGGGGGTNVTLNTPTWNGQSMTQLTYVHNTTVGVQAWVYYVKASAAATANVAATTTGTGSNFSNIVAGYVVCTGVDPTTPTSGLQSFFPGTWAAPNLSISSATGSLVVQVLGDLQWDAAFSSTVGTTYTETGAQVREFLVQESAAAGNAQFILALASGAGTVSLTDTVSANQPSYVHIGFSINAPSGGGSVQGENITSATFMSMNRGFR